MMFLKVWMTALLAGSAMISPSFAASASADDGNAGRILQSDTDTDTTEGEDSQSRVRTDFIRLTPFDVQLLMTGPISEVNIFALTDIVTDWLSDSFAEKSLTQATNNNELALIGNETSFDSLGLELRSRRLYEQTQQRSQQKQQRSQLKRDLQDSTDNNLNFFSVSYDGVTLWQRVGSTTPPVEQEVVEYIQRATFLEDRQLLNLLQSADAEITGLGSSVFDVRVFIGNTTPAQDSSNNANLEIIIIIAIVVACLAFGLLMFAVIWAWRTDKTKRDAYKVGGERSLQPVQVPTGSESDYNEKSPTGMTPPTAAVAADTRAPPISLLSRPPAEIAPTDDYPESVISEDISTSLTAYYRSGLPGYNSSNNPRTSTSASGFHAAPPAHELNDAASMSSMDSYGYSLDGYAPSLGPAPQGYPIGPMNGMIKDPGTDYEAGDEDDDGHLTASSLGEDTNQ